MGQQTHCLDKKTDTREANVLLSSQEKQLSYIQLVVREISPRGNETHHGKLDLELRVSLLSLGLALRGESLPS